MSNAAISQQKPRTQIAIVLGCLILLPTVGRAELVINGVEPRIAKNVQAFVALAGEPCDAEEWRIRRRLRNVDEEVRSALEPFGYYSPTLETIVTEDDKCWQATLNITPGSQVLWRQVDTGIIGDAAKDGVFIDRLPPPPAVGSPLRHQDYEQYKQALQVTALDRGYLDAVFSSVQFDVWPDELAADTTLAFNSGPRYDVGEITFNQSVFESSLVERYVDLETGVPFDSAELTKAYRDLTDSGYFRRVDITPEYEKASDNQIPITVSLEASERIEYTIGAGFATDTGPRLRGGFRNRRVNDRGDRINSYLRISPVITGMSGEYRKPLSDPRSDWLSYVGSIDREITDTSENARLQLGVRRSKRLSESWIRTLSLDYSYERYTVAGIDDISQLILPGIAFDHKSADRDLYPSHGRRLSFEFRGADESLASSTSFLQIVARIKWITSFGDNTRLLTRLTAGVTTKDDFDELPPSLRFYAGGDESVRGFGYQTLGPEDEDGNVIGGSHLMVASIEVERHLRGNFYGAVFVDAGNAFDGTEVDAAISAGLGVKWRSPVGPLRMYLGHPLNKSDRSVRVHVSLGMDL